jgi:uncharacterized RDD family membrane protein YckC
MKAVGVGTRVLNFLVDTFLIVVISFLLMEWYNFQVTYWRYPPVPHYAFFAVTLVVYYFLFESIFKRTPGKWLTMSKVVSQNAQKPNAARILARSLVRLIIVDCFFIPFLNNRALHDYLSGTLVVEA